MKKEYKKPTSEILEIEPLQMICTSLSGEDTTPEDEEWFDMPSTDGDKKCGGILD